MNFLFTCGGTAGHINPALAVAGILRDRMPDCGILFVGANGKMETDLVPRAGYDIVTIEVTNIHRSLKPSEIAYNFRSLHNARQATKDARKIIEDFKPDVAIGTGGYVCYPVLKAAAQLGIPTVVHESNAVPGLTTKMLAGAVDRILVGFEESKQHYSEQEKVVVTGTPVRQDFFRLTKAEAKRQLGVDDGRPLLVSFWGSLGASGMNRQMADFLALEAAKEPFHHIHGAGKDGYPVLLKLLQEKGVDLADHPALQVREYIYDMPLVMAAADVVLCRAGASTISELTAIAKPSILVPSPNVTANHQEKNARVLADQGAAVLLLDNSAADVMRETYADMLVAIDDFDTAMLKPGLVAHVQGRRVLALDGFEAALTDKAAKQRMWAYIKQLTPAAAPL